MSAFILLIPEETARIALTWPTIAGEAELCWRADNEVNDVLSSSATVKVSTLAARWAVKQRC